MGRSSLTFAFSPFDESMEGMDGYGWVWDTSYGGAPLVFVFRGANGKIAEGKGKAMVERGNGKGKMERGWVGDEGACSARRRQALNSRGCRSNEERQEQEKGGLAKEKRNRNIQDDMRKGERVVRRRDVI